jgi:hypothetical protein
LTTENYFPSRLQEIPNCPGTAEKISLENLPLLFPLDTQPKGKPFVSKLKENILGIGLVAPLICVTIPKEWDKLKKYPKNMEPGSFYYNRVKYRLSVIKEDTSLWDVEEKVYVWIGNQRVTVLKELGATHTDAIILPFSGIPKIRKFLSASSKIWKDING